MTVTVTVFLVGVFFLVTVVVVVFREVELVAEELVEVEDEEVESSPDFLCTLALMEFLLAKISPEISSPSGVNRNDTSPLLLPGS